MGTEILRSPTINRGATDDSPDCHPEPFASLKGKLREGSVSLGRKMLRSPTKDLYALHCVPLRGATAWQGWTISNVTGFCQAQVLSQPPHCANRQKNERRFDRRTETRAAVENQAFCKR